MKREIASWKNLKWCIGESSKHSFTGQTPEPARNNNAATNEPCHLFSGENILNSVLENAMLLPFRVKK